MSASEISRFKVQCSERSDERRGWPDSSSEVQLKEAKRWTVMIPKGNMGFIKPTSEQSKVSSAALKCLCRYVAETFCIIM